MNTTRQRRLQILSDEEIEAIYSQPRFTDEDRIQYFCLSGPERDLLANLRSVKSQVYFVLQLGYFKAKHLFFTFDLIEVCKDVEYVLSQYFNNSELLSLTTIDKQTRLTQQHLIRQRFNYRSCDAQAREKLEAKAEQLASVCVKPIYIFRELIDYLSFQRIVAPGYSFMQDTIGRALDFEQKRLTTIVHNHLTHPDILALNGLLSNSEGLYEITQLKREPKEFSLSEIKREINRAGQIHLLYSLAKRLLPDMKISGESIKYYASLVSYYSVYKLKRLNKWTAYIYLLCFVYHRYQRQNDNLVNCLIYNVRRYVDEAKATAKERVYQLSISNNLNLQKAGYVLKLFTDSSIAKNTPFEQVQTKAFGILPRQKLSMIADQITTQARFDETEFQWECVDKLAHQFKRHMRPILLAVDFATSKASDPLIEAVCCLKAAFGKRKPLSQYSADTFPVAFIPESTKRYLYATDSTGNKRLLVDRYEFLIYRLVRNGIQAGDIFCRDSVRFRSFDDDLIDDKTWQNKEKLIAQTGIAILKQPILAHLATLEHQLEDRITQVNQRIISGENEHFKSKKRGAHRSWTLQYPRARELVNHPFFDTLSQVDIGRILHFVNQQCQFMEGFTHLPTFWDATSNRRLLLGRLRLVLWLGGPIWDSARWAKSPISHTKRFQQRQII